MLETILKVLAAVATVAGIYGGWVVLQSRMAKKAEARFGDVRDHVKTDREKWRRETLVTGRQPDRFQIQPGVPLYVRDGWLPPQPIPLENMTLLRAGDSSPTIKVSPRNLPRVGGKRPKAYSAAIAQLDHPAVFEDRPQYRLLEVHSDSLVYSDEKYTYFDKIDQGEYLMYELVHDKLYGEGLWATSGRDLILRSLCEPKDYTVLTGVSTLTLIHTGSDLRMVMHQRGKRKTAYAMGTYHVTPAGEFQPSCQAASSFSDDFCLWKNIMREYAEELGGMEEYDGSSAVPFSYDDEIYSLFETERGANNIKAFYLGIGLDVITFQGEILTVVVFKEDTFMRVFPKVLTENSEGKLITDKHRWGRPFTEQELEHYRNENTLATGEAILNIAWRNRAMFLTCFDNRV